MGYRTDENKLTQADDYTQGQYWPGVKVVPYQDELSV